MKEFDINQITNNTIISIRGKYKTGKHFLTKNIIFNIQERFQQIFVFNDKRYSDFYKTFVHISAINENYKESYNDIIKRDNLVVFDNIDIKEIPTENIIISINKKIEFDVIFIFEQLYLNDIQNIYKECKLNIPFIEFFDIYKEYTSDKYTSLVVYKGELYYYKVKDDIDFYISNFTRIKKVINGTFNEILDNITDIVVNCSEFCKTTFLLD
jgi:hypothetical protein